MYVKFVMVFRGHSRYAALVQPGMLIVPRVSIFLVKGGIDEAFYQIQKTENITAKSLKYSRMRFVSFVSIGSL